MANDQARAKRRRKALRGGAAGLAAFALTVLLHVAGAFRTLEWRSWDGRLRLLADPGRASADIVLLAVDQVSLDHFEKEQGLGWPWPRQLYAGVLDFLKAGGAKAVFFDITMTESSTYGVEDDQLLAEAMARAGNVVLPVFLSADEKASDPGARELLARGALEDLGPAARAAGPVARSVALPVGELAAAAARLGNVHFVPDGDSVYRRLPLVAEYEGLRLASLPLTLANLLGAGPDPADVPLDRSGAMILRFHGPDRTYKTYSIAAVINSQAQIEEGREPQVRPAEFAGKTVLVGATAAGLLDFRPTPFGGAYPGMEILATALDNLVQRDFVREAPPAWTWVSALLLALAAGIGTSLLKKPGHMAAFGLAVPAGTAAGALLAARAGLWIELVAPAFAALSGFVAVLALLVALPIGWVATHVADEDGYVDFTASRRRRAARRGPSRLRPATARGPLPSDPSSRRPARSDTPR